MSHDAIRAIRTEIDRFVEAYNHANLNDLLKTYSNDLLKHRQNAPTENKDQTAARLVTVFEKNFTQVEVTVDEITVEGRLAFASGSFVVALTPKSGGQTLRIARRYLELWRKEDETWRVFRTMDNVDS